MTVIACAGFAGRGVLPSGAASTHRRWTAAFLPSEVPPSQSEPSLGPENKLFQAGRGCSIAEMRKEALGGHPQRRSSWSISPAPGLDHARLKEDVHRALGKSHPPNVLDLARVTG